MPIYPNHFKTWISIALTRRDSMLLSEPILLILGRLRSLNPSSFPVAQKTKFRSGLGIQP